jgi:hypothetical protein
VLVYEDDGLVHVVSLKSSSKGDDDDYPSVVVHAIGVEETAVREIRGGSPGMQFILGIADCPNARALLNYAALEWLIMDGPFKPDPVLVALAYEVGRLSHKQD